jgi:hypothetical protein
MASRKLELFIKIDADRVFAKIRRIALAVRARAEVLSWSCLNSNKFDRFGFAKFFL